MKVWLDILSKKTYQGVEGDEKEVAVLVLFGKMSKRFARFLYRFTSHHGRMARGRRRMPLHFLLHLQEHQATCKDHGMAANDMEQVGALHM